MSSQPPASPYFAKFASLSPALRDQLGTLAVQFDAIPAIHQIEGLYSVVIECIDDDTDTLAEVVNVAEGMIWRDADDLAESLAYVLRNDPSDYLTY